MKFIAALLLGITLFLTPVRAGCDTPTTKDQLVVSYSDVDGKYWAPVIVFDRRFEDGNTTLFNKAFADVEAQGPDYIIVEVNSNGGDIDAGWEMMRTVERSHTKTICIAENNANSMAVYFMQACTVRVATKRSTLLVHYGYWPSLTNQREQDFENTWHRQLALNKQCIAMLHRFKVSPSYIKAKLDKEDWILDPQEALKVGAVDQVVDSVESVQKYVEIHGKLPK